MRVPFTKMHGAGNDFVVVLAGASAGASAGADAHAHAAWSPGRIAALSDRHTGIGCDQFIVVGTAPGVDATMAIYNADGSLSGACGNATRCVAALLHARGAPANLAIQTAAGVLRADVRPDGLVTVDMGPPLLAWADIPLAHAADTLRLDLPGGPAAASMGNPHVTFFGDPEDVAVLGPRYETHALFPQRVNVGVAGILAPDRLRLRVWERGAGLTRACGSGACAAVVNAHRRGLTGRCVTVQMDGGALLIDWREDGQDGGGHVMMTGPAATVYEGVFETMEQTQA